MIICIFLLSLCAIIFGSGAQCEAEIMVDQQLEDEFVWRETKHQ